MSLSPASSPWLGSKCSSGVNKAEGPGSGASRRFSAGHSHVCRPDVACGGDAVQLRASPRSQQSGLRRAMDAHVYTRGARVTLPCPKRR